MGKHTIYGALAGLAFCVGVVLTFVIAGLIPWHEAPARLLSAWQPVLVWMAIGAGFANLAHRKQGEK